MARTSVGDRYVFEHMREHGFNVGGEQSGHIILTDHSTTGDGLLAALQVLAAMIESDAPLSQIGRIFTPFPQRLKNVRFAAGSEPLKLPQVVDAIREAETRLNGTGRLLLRKSGTEPVIRVMAEGEDEALVLEVVDQLSSLIAAVAGAPDAKPGSAKH